MYCAVPISNAMSVMKATILSSYWLVLIHRAKHQSAIVCRGNALHGFAMRTEVSAVFISHNIEHHLLSDDVTYPIFLTSFLPLIVLKSYTILYFGA